MFNADLPSDWFFEDFQKIELFIYLSDGYLKNDKYNVYFDFIYKYLNLGTLF